MTTHTKIKNRKKYENNYVAVKSFGSKDVISFGKNFDDAYQSAVKKGVNDPVVFFVCPKGMSYMLPVICQ